MFILIFTLAFAIFVAEAELDIIVPSFPEIQAIFGLTTFQTELILSVNLIAHCIMAIFAGMIGDKFGKKPAIIGGIIAFLLGSFVTIITNNYYILLLGRILQGGGAAFPMVLSFIVAIKSVSPAKRVKVGGILAGIATISVAIAPTIGSYITYYFGYKGNMIFIAGLGIVSLILCSNFIKHDGEVNSKASLSVGSYIVVFKSKLTMLYIFALGFELAAYYTFIALAPIYYINSLGVSLKHFGLYQAVITLSFGLSSFFSSDIIKVIGKRIALIVSLLLLSSSMYMIVYIGLQKVDNPVFITLAFAIFAVGVVVPYNAAYVLVSQSIVGAEGKVSALLTTVRWLLSSIAIQIAGYFYDNTLNSTIILVTTLTTLATFIFILIFKIDPKFRKEIWGT